MRWAGSAAAGSEARPSDSCRVLRPNSRPKRPAGFSALVSIEGIDVSGSARNENASSASAPSVGSAAETDSQGFSSNNEDGICGLGGSTAAGTTGPSAAVSVVVSHSNGFKNSAGVVVTAFSVSQSKGLRNSAGISFGSSRGSWRGGRTGPLSAHSRIDARPPDSSAPPENTSFHREGVSSLVSVSRSGRFSLKVSGREGAGGAVGASGAGSLAAPVAGSSSAVQLDALRGAGVNGNSRSPIGSPSPGLELDHLRMLPRMSSPGASSFASHSVDGNGSGASSTARRRSGIIGSLDQSLSSWSSACAGCSAAFRPPLASRKVPPAVVCSSGSSWFLPRPKKPRFSSFFGALNGSVRGLGVSRLR